MSHDPDPAGVRRTIPDPGFAGDDGSADAALAAALEAFAVDPERHLEAFLALQSARVLVPVIAIPGDVEVDAAGLASEKTSDMATLLITGRDGRQALPAFTSTQTLAAWRPDARPVPVAAPLAARSAVQGGADALLLDVAGPTTYVVEGELLQGLARGWVLERIGDELAWRPDVE